MDLAQSMAENFDEGPSTSSSPDSCPKEVKERKFKPGDFVGCIDEGSTASKPLVFIGCVHYYISDDEVSLLWYSRDSTGFHLQFHGKQWTKMQDSLVKVTMTPMQRRHGYYTLSTSPRTIHKALTAL